MCGFSLKTQIEQKNQCLAPEYLCSFCWTFSRALKGHTPSFWGWRQKLIKDHSWGVSSSEYQVLFSLFWPALLIREWNHQRGDEIAPNVDLFSLSRRPSLLIRHNEKNTIFLWGNCTHPVVGFTAHISCHMWTRKQKARAETGFHTNILLGGPKHALKYLPNAYINDRLLHRTTVKLNLHTESCLSD